MSKILFSLLFLVSCGSSHSSNSQLQAQKFWYFTAYYYKGGSVVFGNKWKYKATCIANNVATYKAGLGAYYTTSDCYQK